MSRGQGQTCPVSGGCPLFLFWDGCHCGPAWPWTHRSLPSLASWVLRWQMCVASCWGGFFCLFWGRSKKKEGIFPRVLVRGGSKEQGCAQPQYPLLWQGVCTHSSGLREGGSWQCRGRERGRLRSGPRVELSRSNRSANKLRGAGGKGSVELSVCGQSSTGGPGGEAVCASHSESKDSVCAPVL